MPPYTTGELAKACGVSVRTVQYYDTKNLLKPTALSEGGRRLYTDKDLQQLHLICVLKSLGLSLDAVKGILISDKPNEFLLLLLKEQEKQVHSEMKQKQNQIETIQIAMKCIQSTDTIPVNTINDIAQIMSNKKLKHVHTSMLLIGSIMTVILWGSFFLWILNGLWTPFIVCLPVVVLLGTLSAKTYYKKTAYICAKCKATFNPQFINFIFSKHTPKTRKLTCPHCGSKSYCIEGFSEI